MQSTVIIPWCGKWQITCALPIGIGHYGRIIKGVLSVDLVTFGILGIRIWTELMQSWCTHSSSDHRAERTCAHGALKCTVLLEFNTFQSQLTLLFYTACLFSYFSCPWVVCLVQYLLVVLFFSFVINVFKIMDGSSRRLRSQVPEAGEGPSLLDLFKLIQSDEKKKIRLPHRPTTTDWKWPQAAPLRSRN